MRTHRLAQLREQIAQQQGTAMLVTNAKNIFYLTGFIGISPTDRESALLVTKNAAYLFVPAMYAEHASSLPLEKYGITMITNHERYGLLSSFARYITKDDTVLCESNDVRIAEREYIEEKSGYTLSPKKNIVEALRLIKDADEISLLKHACAITEQVLEDIISLLRNTPDLSTLTELDIADAMRGYGRRHGADGFGFDPIVAVGPHASEPHYITGTTPLKTQSCLLLDFGFAYHGYTADLSRTLFLGKADTAFTDMYRHVQRVHDTCIQEAGPGTRAGALHERSIALFDTQNLAQHYVHSLGHGLGLDVHESPSVSTVGDTVLTPGMVITIEPGLYFPSAFGIRIEDDILITHDGCERLTTSTSDLIEI